MHYVYLLHFHKPLKHALHYVGCTGDIVQRLADHAHGRGASITTACRERGIEWTVAALWKLAFAGEHALKARKNVKLYCPICNPYPFTLDGNDPFPLELTGIARHSYEIRQLVQ
jgi:predicted GIY-YIG superfamily endonuclease